MRNMLTFVYFLIFVSLALPKESAAEPVICDPMQAIAIQMEVSIKNDVFTDLQELGIQEMSLTPAADFSWTEVFPVKDGAKLTLIDKADPLSLSLQDGLLVTYKSCEDDIVYAYCQLPREELKGTYPKDVKLHLTPALNQCTIEVVCTQCP